MDSKRHRRNLLKQIGAAVGAGTLLTSTASARGDGTAPSDRVETEDVSIFSAQDDPTTVATGSWINHRFGWLDANGESTREGIERFFDAVELTIWIDGELVEDHEQYWRDPYQNEDGDWLAYWEYVTKPKSPGLYEFSVEFYFPDGLYDSGEEVRPPETRNLWTGYYEVTPDGR